MFEGLGNLLVYAPQIMVTIAKWFLSRDHFFGTSYGWTGHRCRLPPLRTTAIRKCVQCFTVVGNSRTLPQVEFSHAPGLDGYVSTVVTGTTLMVDHWVAVEITTSDGSKFTTEFLTNSNGVQDIFVPSSSFRAELFDDPLYADVAFAFAGAHGKTLKIYRYIQPSVYTGYCLQNAHVLKVFTFGGFGGGSGLIRDDDSDRELDKVIFDHQLEYDEVRTAVVQYLAWHLAEVVETPGCRLEERKVIRGKETGQEKQNDFILEKPNGYM
ncbi:hypothetical protein BT69DRAFT_1296157 [Atractiella rhizophila]|nr:hypothetical protein BT69DRAFT_1296157 [Atractiella rhizophila]